MLSQIYQDGPGDEEIIEIYYELYIRLSHEELTQRCKSAQIFSVHFQSLRLTTLSNAAKDRDIQCNINFAEDSIFDYDD